MQWTSSRECCSQTTVQSNQLFRLSFHQSLLEFFNQPYKAVIGFCQANTERWLNENTELQSNEKRRRDGKFNKICIVIAMRKKNVSSSVCRWLMSRCQKSSQRNINLLQLSHKTFAHGSRSETDAAWFIVSRDCSSFFSLKIRRWSSRGGSKQSSTSWWSIESRNYWNSHQLFSAVACQILLNNWSALASLPPIMMNISSSSAILGFFSSSSFSPQHDKIVQQLDSWLESRKKAD